MSMIMMGNDSDASDCKDDNNDAGNDNKNDDTDYNDNDNNYDQTVDIQITLKRSNGLVVKTLDSQSRSPLFKTTGLLQGRVSLSSFRGR